MESVTVRVSRRLLLLNAVLENVLVKVCIIEQEE
jgi:hypothetical protein